MTVLADPQMQARIKSMGFEATPTTPEQYSGILRSQIENWQPLIERAGITLN